MDRRAPRLSAREPDMSAVGEILKQRLLDIDGVTVANWKDTDFVCVNFNGKEVAHFHGDNVLDLRLSQKIIREEHLTRDVSQAIHPERTLKSRWICVALHSQDDIDRILHLVARACSERQ